MTTLRPFTCNDMFKFNNVNLDTLTETYGLSFYLQYLAHWPEYFQVAESPNGEIMGYIMGKAEGHAENWHGHVTALTVSPEFRRLGLAATLMAWLEDVSEKKRAYFVDLFVRVSNKVAINMYKRLGYIVYRTVLEYYSGDPDEDAFDMRKALSRDVKKKSVIPLTHPVRPEDVDYSFPFVGCGVVILLLLLILLIVMLLLLLALPRLRHLQQLQVYINAATHYYKDFAVE